MTDMDIDYGELSDVSSDNGSLDIIFAVVGTAVVVVAGSVISYYCGKSKGYEEGFEAASEIYDKKMRDQQDECESVKKKYEDYKKKSDKAMDAYEEYIKDLTKDS